MPEVDPRRRLTSFADMETETITYTARELHRSTTKVLKTNSNCGKARIWTRSVENYVITPKETSQPTKKGRRNIPNP